MSDLGNILFTYSSWADSGLLGGGGWLLPLTNLQSNDYRVARSLDLDPANTVFYVAMNGPATLRGIQLGPGNLTTGFSYRISWDGGTTGWISGQAQAEWNTLTWEDPDFWSGFPAWEDSERGIWLIHMFDEPVTSVNWAIELDDRGNPDGYLQFRRLMMGRSWQPSMNYQYGSGLSFRDASFKSTSLAGTKKFWRRVNPRVLKVAFEGIPDSEAFDSAYDFIRTIGYDGEVFIIPDPTDLINIHKRSFLATASSIDPISQAVLGHSTIGFEFEEVL